MDVSFLDEIECGPGRFYDQGEEQDLLRIIRNHGANAIRLRLWVDPPGEFCNLDHTIAMAQRIHTLGLPWLLDFHYSDGWADPGKQVKPRAWSKFDRAQLLDAVYEYTRTTLEQLKGHGVWPAHVQIGNEITNGLLWDTGRIGGKFDTDSQWEVFSSLVNRGIQGVREAAGGQPASILIHIDRGGDNAGSRKFFDRLALAQTDFDAIALSYYPWWHGSLDDLEKNLQDLAWRYQKDIFVVETAYPWTVEGPQGVVTKDTDLRTPFPATVDGQSDFLRSLLNIVKKTPNGRGKGVYYWEPDWIPSQNSWSVGHANNWANLTLFDFEGNALKSLEVFRERGT